MHAYSLIFLRKYRGAKPPSNKIHKKTEFVVLATSTQPEVGKKEKRSASTNNTTNTTCKTGFGNGHRSPLVAPITDQVLQISQER
jgi:hypothetical protein